MMGLTEALRQELREFMSTADKNEVELLIRAYNNDEGLRRARNHRPRTCLMLGGVPEIPCYATSGIIPHVGKRALGEDSRGCHTSIEKYVDFGVLCGAWPKGQCHWRLIAEVENQWWELRGTLADLLCTQARIKWAILYNANPESARMELQQAVPEVFDHFAKAGFLEHPDTLYEVLVLPDLMPASGPSGMRAVEATFSSRAAMGEIQARLVSL